LAPEMRTEGAALFALLRNIGAAIGVSVTSTVLARNTQALHEVIGASVTPFNHALSAVAAFDLHSPHGMALLDQVVNQQAEIIAYANDYVLLICTTLPAALLLPLMRKPRQDRAAEAEPVE
jgi:DHA2 family multidrug resistance protein